MIYLCNYLGNGEVSWWRHQMETFSAILALCAGNSPVIDEFPEQRPVTQSFDVFFDLHLNKWLSKQSWGWWFKTQSCSLWRHRNVMWSPQLVCLFFHFISLCAISQKGYSLTTPKHNKASAGCINVGMYYIHFTFLTQHYIPRCYVSITVPTTT